MVKRTGSDCRERSASVADYLHGYKRIALTALKPWDNNPRTHSPAQIEQLRASIREFGFTNPIMAGAGGKFAPLTEAATCKLCLRYYPSGFAPK